METVQVADWKEVALDVGDGRASLIIPVLDQCVFIKAVVILSAVVFWEGSHGGWEELRCSG